MNIKKISIISLFIAISTNCYASLELAKTKNCLACHAEEKKLVGPSFKDIKEKYEKNPGVLDKLTQKVMKGGSGVWGPVPMPSNNQVNEEEAKELVKWILGTKVTK